MNKEKKIAVLLLIGSSLLFLLSLFFLCNVVFKEVSHITSCHKLRISNQTERIDEN